MRAERLAWCLAHERWTLEDWKNVIFSDETSVILLHRRGGYCVWRSKDKAFLRSCIVNVRKARLNLCFGAAFRTIRRVLATVGALKPLLRSFKQSKRLKLLIERLNLSYRSSRSLRLAYDVSIFVDSPLVESLHRNSISKMASFHEDLRAESTGIAIKR
jgi:hypothetical protein